MELLGGWNDLIDVKVWEEFWNMPCAHDAIAIIFTLIKSRDMLNILRIWL